MTIEEDDFLSHSYTNKLKVILENHYHLISLIKLIDVFNIC